MGAIDAHDVSQVTPKAPKAWYERQEAVNVHPGATPTPYVRAKGDHLTVDAPYHPSMPNEAKAMGGKWDNLAKKWIFDIRDAEAVRAMLIKIYGTDGSDRVPLVTVHAELQGRIGKDNWWWMARQILKCFERDMPVKLAPAVKLLAGKFADHGGSRSSPDIGNVDGVVIEIRDVPEPLARERLSKVPAGHIKKAEIV